MDVSQEFIPLSTSALDKNDFKGENLIKVEEKDCFENSNVVKNNNHQVKSMENKCQVCSENDAKYKCPKCCTRTCCLKCVNDHKNKTDCNGIRDKTSFIKVSEFADGDLLSDYRFLEDVNRNIDNYERHYKKQRKSNKTKSVQILSQNAKRQSIKLILLPTYSSIRKENSTYYCFKRQQFLWHLQLEFYKSDVKIFDKRISDKITIDELLNRCFQSTTSQKDKLTNYLTSDGFHPVNVYMKVERLPANQIRYFKLDNTKSLHDNFTGKTIVEYPRLHIALTTQSEDFEDKIMKQEEPSVNNNNNHKIIRKDHNKRSSPPEENSPVVSKKPMSDDTSSINFYDAVSPVPLANLFQ